MPKIIINYKICDKAPECGGIANCPNHAITYDESQKRPVWHPDKCTFCLRCTLPDSCPVGAIMYASDQKQEADILNSIAADPHDDDWLWLERYGTFPTTTKPLATIITPSNFDQIIYDPSPKLIDIWHPDFVDCRLHSPLFSDLTSGHQLNIFKLNSQDYPELAQKLDISTYPSLIFHQKDSFTPIAIGYIKDTQMPDIIEAISNLINN